MKKCCRNTRRRMIMEISALQKARYEYAPKLPGMLRHGIADICVKEGEETQSVADQEKIKALFPNTYGKKEITFQKGANTSVAKKQVVGVILSGGQAPGGHNVICGLYDALKATNPENVLYGFKNGPSGLIEDDYLVFDDEYIMHTETQAVSISSVPAEPNWRLRNSSQSLLKSARSTASPQSLSSVATIPTPTQLYWLSTSLQTTPAYR